MLLLFSQPNQQGGVRSMFAFWMGGASAHTIPPYLMVVGLLAHKLDSLG